jgi:hypothetical protein
MYLCSSPKHFSGYLQKLRKKIALSQNKKRVLLFHPSTTLNGQMWSQSNDPCYTNYVHVIKSLYINAHAFRLLSTKISQVKFGKFKDLKVEKSFVI